MNQLDHVIMRSNGIQSEEDYDECLAIFQAVKRNIKGDYFHSLKMEVANLINDYEEETNTLKDYE